MKNLTLLIICLFLASTTLYYPAVQAAPMTTIYQVTTPSGSVAGSQHPIAVAVYVSYNTRPGYQLVVGVLDADLAPQRIVPGAVVSSTDPCINQPEAAALCAIRLEKSSGLERIDFQLGGIFGGRRKPGAWDLNVTSAVMDHQNALVPGSISSKLFKIDLRPVVLNVDAPPNVAVSIDGVPQPSGSVSVGVALGQHDIVVPRFVNVTQVTRLRFDHWSDNYPSTSRTILVTNATTLRAGYVKQNLLTLIGTQGDASAYSWYDASSNATFSANQYQPMWGLLGALGVRLSLQGWYENGQLLTNSPSATIPMDEPHTLTAVWRVDYSLPATIALVTAVAAILGLVLIQQRNRTTTLGANRRKINSPTLTRRECICIQGLLP